MGKYKGFNSVELRRPKRSLFDLSHENRLTTVMGRLTPIYIEETMPNDTFKCNSEVMLRMAPLLAPIMHRVNVFVHFFFVPNRLLWEDWELFITNGRLGTETPPVPPYMSITKIKSEAGGYLLKSTLADYLGVGNIADADVYTGINIDAMPFIAYNKIWYDYYRDRNYQADDYFATEFPVPSGELDVSTANNERYLQVKIRGWEHDYFTSALPWTQRGDEVLMPLEGSGSVQYLTVSKVISSIGNPVVADKYLITGDDTANGELKYGDSDLVPDSQARIENIDSVDIFNSNVSINDLRRALRLQEWLERNALAGSRYNESIMAHFGRRTSDGRLQRAEYLGGGKVVVKISEVVTTAFSEDADTELVPPASMTGHGISFGNTNRFTYNCEEHGFILGIMSVMPTTAYMQGSKRMFFNRNTFLDYPWPSFAHLGEQPVYNYELVQAAVNTPADRTTQPIFGYQSRYVDWKHHHSETHGDFKDDMDFWHLTRLFASTPTLGGTFVTFDQNLSDRVFAVSGVDTLWCYIYNKVTVVRSLPYFGTPML